MSTAVNSTVFSMRLNSEEKNLAESYSRVHGVSMSEAFKRALFKEIEDEFDVTVADEAYNDYIQSGKKSRPIGELWRECDL